MQLVEFGSIMNMTKGKKPANQSPEKRDGFMPYVDIKAFETNTIENYTDGVKCLPCNEGDILIVCDGSRSGLVGKAIDGYVGSTLAKITADGMMQNYLFYFLRGKYALLNTKKKGTGTPHLNPDLLKKQKLLVPPLPEQERIVTRIEELFSELDKAVETLQTIKQQLAVYRQAVLKEAFEGKFTHEWRKHHSVNAAETVLQEITSSNRVVGFREMMEACSLPDIPVTWKWISIGNISTGAEYGTSQKSLKDGKIPVIRMGNMQNGIIDWSDLVYSNDESEIKKYKLNKGDVLFNRTNSPEHVGKTSVYTGEQVALFAGYIIRINHVPQINSQYLTYYMNSSIARNYSNKVKTDGVNQSNINTQKLYSYPFPLCDIAEQKQIVSALESRLSVCESIEQTVDTTLAQADAMRQSILKQAFEGGWHNE